MSPKVGAQNIVATFILPLVGKIKIDHKMAGGIEMILTVT
jgi:hypothetical protein